MPQHAQTIVAFLALREQGFLVRPVVHQPVLPLAALALLTDGGVEGGVAAHAAVHVHHILLGDAQLGGDGLDLFGAQVALLQRGDLALGLAQVEEQLLLVGRGAHFHERPGAQDIFLNRRADPPHGVGGQTKALVRLEALDRLHEAHIALGDDLANGQAIAAIAHGDLGHETQM